MDGPYLKQEDLTSPEIRAKIGRNTRTAKEATQLIAKRNRKLGPEDTMEAIANTIGIMAAEVIRSMGNIGGPAYAKTIHQLMQHHADRALEMASGSRDFGGEKGPSETEDLLSD